MNTQSRSLADALQPASSDTCRLTVCYPFSGDIVGGSHISTLGLLKQVDPRHFKILVVPEVPDGRVASLFREFDQLQDPASKPKRFAPSEAWGFWKFLLATKAILPRIRFLRRQRVDIVHTNDGLTAANWALAARLAGAKLVWHQRGHPDALGMRLLAPAVADHVLAVSQFAMPAAGWWSTADRAEVVHSPFDAKVTVDRTAARARLLDELGLPEDTMLLGYFGAFLPRKRPLQFVDVISRLRGLVDRPVIGVMFGEAPVPELEEELREHIARCGAGDCIRLMGYRSPGAFWIGACDVLLVPAINEPFGRTLVEAMLVGTPVVASRSGGNIEAIDRGRGILVDPDNAEALAQACARLAKDPAAARMMADYAQADAKRRFGEEEHARRVTEVYARLA